MQRAMIQLKVHHKDLMRLDEKWQKEWDHIFEYSNRIYKSDGTCITPKCDKMIPHALRMLGLLKERIPEFKSKVIIDLPPNFRDSYGKLLICYMLVLLYMTHHRFPHFLRSTLKRFKDGWYGEGDKGVTTMYFWMNYRIGNAYLADKRADYESGLEYIDKALTLIPPLRAGEMPHENEVMARVFRAKALQKLGDVSGAIAEYRVCLAAIRLLDYHGGKLIWSRKIIYSLARRLTLLLFFLDL